MSTANTDFNPESIFLGNSALGIENPAFSDQRKSGKNAVAVADVEDALLLASKYTANELAQMTNPTKAQTDNMIRAAITKVATFRGVDRAEIKAAFDAAQRTNGVHLRRFRETSVVGAVGDANGRSMASAPLGRGDAAPAQNLTMGGEANGVVGVMEDVNVDVEEDIDMQEVANGVMEPTEREDAEPGPIARAVMLISQGQHQAAHDVLAAHGLL